MNYEKQISDERVFMGTLVTDWLDGDDFIIGVNPEHMMSKAHAKLIELLKSLETRDLAVLLAKGDKNLILDLMDLSGRDVLSLYRIVKDHWLKREIRKLADVAHEKFEGGLDALLYLMEELGKREVSVSEGGSDKSHDRFVASLTDRKAHLKTKIPAFDKALGEIELGEKIVIAARPSGGKTSLAACLAHDLNKWNEVSVGFYSMESPDFQIRRRILARKEGISISRMKSHRQGKVVLSDDEVATLIESSKALEMAGVNIYNCSGQSAESVAMQMLVSPHTVCIVDHMQKFRGKDLRQAVGDASALFASVADRKDKVVIMCSQLNRNLEKENREPNFSDLKEAGEIEQDADTIIFIHTDPTEKDCDHVKAKLIIAKRRDGETGFCSVEWDKSTAKFYNHYEPNEEPGF